MLDDLDWDTAKALLEWQVELGATEAICDAPINRYELAATTPSKAAPAQSHQSPRSAPAAIEDIDCVALAQQMADAAPDLDVLRAALEDFDYCELRRGARNLVFADGSSVARVMVLTEPPSREEDRDGRPMVGDAGQLFDRMFAAIGMGRAHPDAARGIYISPILPWRPPQNRAPSEAEMAMMMPFLARHIALVDPDVIVLMGNAPCMALLGKRGITRLRGTWAQALGKPVLPMFDPAYLMQNPTAKREAWADLLALQAQLRTF
jgi:uracil-DNA glycosylase family 4